MCTRLPPTPTHVFSFYVHIQFAHLTIKLVQTSGNGYARLAENQIFTRLHNAQYIFIFNLSHIIELFIPSQITRLIVAYARRHNAHPSVLSSWTSSLQFILTMQGSLIFLSPENSNCWSENLKWSCEKRVLCYIIIILSQLSAIIVFSGVCRELTTRFERQWN